MSKHKIILVTGANSKLGEAIVVKLREAKHFVYRGQRSGGDVEIDVTSERSCKKAVEKIIKQKERIDVVINVAGVTGSGVLEKTTTEEFQKLLDVNAIGQLRLNLFALRYMKQQRSGQIINITSLSGRVPLPGFGIYSASKSAAEVLGEVLHYELQSDNIRVTNIAPGAINFSTETPKALAHRPVREKIPLLKYILPMTTPERISSAIVGLVDSNNNPIRLTLGVDAHIIVFLYTFFPAFLFEKIINYLWQKK